MEEATWETEEDMESKYPHLFSVTWIHVESICL